MTPELPGRGHPPPTHRHSIGITRAPVLPHHHTRATELPAPAPPARRRASTFPADFHLLQHGAAPLQAATMFQVFKPDSRIQVGGVASKHSKKQQEAAGPLPSRLTACAELPTPPCAAAPGVPPADRGAAGNSGGRRCAGVPRGAAALPRRGVLCGGGHARRRAQRGGCRGRRAGAGHAGRRHGALCPSPGCLPASGERRGMLGLPIATQRLLACPLSGSRGPPAALPVPSASLWPTPRPVPALPRTQLLSSLPQLSSGGSGNASGLWQVSPKDVKLFLPRQGTLPPAGRPLLPLVASPAAGCQAQAA